MLKETYLAIIKNSIDSRIFRNLFLDKNDEIVDVLEDGKLSCAFFVSSILKMFDLISSVHATVENTIIDMEKIGWGQVDFSEVEEGDVLIWKEMQFDNESKHKHIGFYIGNHLAISNSTGKRVPVEHDYLFGGDRNIIYVLRMPKGTRPEWPANS